MYMHQKKVLSLNLFQTTFTAFGVSSYLGALKRLEIQIASTLFSVKSSNLACGSLITLEIFSPSQLFDDVIIFADIIKKINRDRIFGNV